MKNGFLELALAAVMGAIIISFVNYFQSPYMSANHYVSTAGEKIVFSNTAPGPAKVQTESVIVHYGTKIRAFIPCKVMNGEKGTLIQFEFYADVYGGNTCVEWGTYLLIYKDGLNDSPPLIVIVSEHWLPVALNE